MAAHIHIETDMKENAETVTSALRKGFDPSLQGPQTLNIELPNGRIKSVTIPAPSAEDVTWLHSLEKQSTKKHEEDASNAIQENNLWRLMVLLKHAKRHQKEDGSNDFMDINCRGKRDSDLTLLGHTSYADAQSHVDAAILLMAYGADPYIGSGSRWTPFVNALNTGEIGIVSVMLEAGYPFYAKDFALASDNATSKEFLKSKFGHLIHDYPDQNLNDAELLEKHSLSGTHWTKIDDLSICKTSYTSKTTRINKVFNFRAQDIERFTETLNNTRTVTSITPSLIQNFSELSVYDEIREAHQQLCDRGGKPENINTYMRHTRHVKKRNASHAK